MIHKIVYAMLLVIVSPAFMVSAQVSGSVSVGSGVAYPIVAPSPVNGDIIQFNNLVIQSVSSVNLPAEIIATANYPVPMPMIQSQPGAAQTPATPSLAPNPGVKCFQFQSRDSAQGSSITCPTPYSPSYHIEVSANTHLFLRDKSAGSLADFATGDSLNVYGFYNTDGTIQALIVRDLSKPVERTFFQLDNTELISVSANTLPATLIVVQRPAYPCYWFGVSGADTKQAYPCPLSSPQLQQGSAMQSLKVPQSLMPIWDMVRKYEVHVNSNTFLLDRNRKNISLADLKAGDKLNIYGEMSGTNGPIDADIVRDVSQPAAVTSYSGRVTAVNPDGSFVIQNSDGELITVQNAIQVGAMVKLTGILDELSKIITQVSQITVNN